MQVFLPYSDFNKIAACLDKKRLFKQVVEARQILSQNGIVVIKNNGEQYRPTHPSHPATKMWVKYNNSLITYHNILLEKCKEVGFKTLMGPLELTGPVEDPPWVHDIDLINSHRSNLLVKKSSYYSKFEWDVPLGLPYIWYDDNGRFIIDKRKKHVRLP